MSDNVVVFLVVVGSLFAWAALEFLVIVLTRAVKKVFK